MKLQRPGKKVLIIAVSLILIGIVLSVGFVLGQNKSNRTPDYEANVSSTENPIKLQDSALEISDIDIYKLWVGVNDQRIAAGIAALSLNPKLNQSAAAKCKDMVNKNYWSHYGPDGSQPWQFITTEGIPYVHLGENIGEGFHSADAEVKGWMKSEEHKANILDQRFTDVGYAVCKSEHFIQNHNQPALLVVQHFAQL
jgi:hypothetical protein